LNNLQLNNIPEQVFFILGQLRPKI
jgi:hypothetical protein